MQGLMGLGIILGVAVNVLCAFRQNKFPLDTFDRTLETKHGASPILFLWDALTTRFN